MHVVVNFAEKMPEFQSYDRDYLDLYFFFANRIEDSQERMKIYLTMAEKFPRAQCPKRLPLNFLTGLYLYVRCSE